MSNSLIALLREVNEEMNRRPVIDETNIPRSPINAVLRGLLARDPAARDFGRITFKVGDIVSRDGTDEQYVVRINCDVSFEVVCIKAPRDWDDNSWCEVGELESNYMSHYNFVRRPTDPMEVIQLKLTWGNTE